jgi:hypothetical protein
MKKKEVFPLKAVYEQDIEKFLLNLGMLEDVKKGSVKCRFCTQIITLSNFGGLVRIINKLEVFCDRIECYIKMLEERKKHVTPS